MKPCLSCVWISVGEDIIICFRGVSLSEDNVLRCSDVCELLRLTHVAVPRFPSVACGASLCEDSHVGVELL